MNILLVEDDTLKAVQLNQFVQDVLPSSSCVHMDSYKSAIRETLNKPYDLFLLDMTLPVFSTSNPRESSGKTLVYGGRLVMRETRRLGIHVPSICVTQFETFGEGREMTDLRQLRSEMAEEFQDRFLDLVFYKPSQSSWKPSLKELLLARFNEVTF